METNFSPEQMLKDIQELKQSLSALFSRSNSSKTRALLLGPTGSGKTTLMHLISGCQMIATKIPRNPSLVLQCDGNCPVSKLAIGHTRAAETVRPALLDKNHALFCDCPGLLDNRSFERRILNSFAINQLLSQPCKIKILLVLAQTDFESGRGKIAIEFFKQCASFFTNYNQMEQCVGLVITKMDPETNATEILEYADDKRLEKHPLLTFFLNHPERCFQMYKASRNTSNNFNDKEKLLNFMKSGAVINPIHNIILDDNSIQRLCLMCSQMNEKMNQYLLQFSHNLSERFRSIKKVSELNSWIDKIEQMRLGVSQGVEQFYQVISQFNIFNSVKQVLEKFILWSLFFNQVAPKWSELASSKFSFTCNSLIKALDNQIEELRNRRNDHEKQVQLLRDQNVFTITQQLDQIVENCGINQCHQSLFFDFLKEQPSHYCDIVKSFDPIVFQYDGQSNNILHCKMNKESVKQLAEQMKLILKELLNYFKLTKCNAITNSILNRIETSEEDPDTMSEFKKFLPKVGNKVGAFFESYAHPINDIVAIPVLIGTVLKPVFKKKKDIQNIEKMGNWYCDNTWMKRNFVYQKIVAPMLRKYREISKLCQQGCSIGFNYGPICWFEFPFYDIQPILPNNSFHFLITQCKMMNDLIETANNHNSMEVFNGIQSIYLRVCGEITQRKINRKGFEILKSVSRGENIDKALLELSDNLENDTNSDDKIELYSQILATTRMLGAIYGRGIGSHERKDLFGIITTVNCQNKDGSIRVYCRQNAKDLNNTVITRLRDLICDLDNSIEQSIGTFSPDSFVKTARDYINKIESEYETSKENMLDSIQNLLTKLNSLISKSYNRCQQKSCGEGKKLLDELKKVDGVQIDNEKNNFVSIHLKGSIFRVGVSSLISIAPEIRKAVTSTMEFIQMKNKYEKACSYKSLISFYKHTNTALQNPNTQGVIVNIKDNKLLSVEPIMLIHDSF